VLLVWARAVATVTHLHARPNGPGFSDVLPCRPPVGVAVGGIFAFVIFAATAFALPMMLDRDADAVTRGPDQAERGWVRNKPAALLWAAMNRHAGRSLVRHADGCVRRFLVAFPVLGHATWRPTARRSTPRAWPARLGKVD